MTRVGRFLRRLARHRSGVALTEFALSMPLLMLAGLGGVELANYAIVNMRVSQLAMQIADNATRIGDTSALASRQIFESDINDLLVGANIQSGAGLNLFEHGRVIISSLEVWDPDYYCTGGTCPTGAPADGAQFIHWQRCKGKMHAISSYGVTGDSLPSGMGPNSYKVLAQEGDAVNFVEITYEYQPIVTGRIVPNRTIRAVAAFMVREQRDLSQIYQRNPGSPDPVSDCNAYDAFS